MEPVERAPAARLRTAEPGDVAAIAELYNHEIRNGLALWNTAERSLAAMTEWRQERRDGGFPVIVAEESGPAGFLGYGTFGPFRPHDGYRATVEHSLYVTPAARGRGVGRLLLQALEDAARAQGRHVMLGGIEAGNAASLALHAAFGFVETARMPEVGRKFDRWLTLVMMQKTLD